MVGLDNPLHIAMLLVVVLLVFGAKRLPEMGKSLGEGLRGFKDSISGEEPRPELTASALRESVPTEVTERERVTADVTEREHEPVG